VRSTPATESARGIQAAIVAYVLWGLVTLYWKELASFRPFELIGWRLVSTVLVMLAVVAHQGGLGGLWRGFADRSTRWRIVVAGILLTLNWTSYVWAVTNDRVLETALGYFMSPLGTMVLGITVLRERPTTVQRLALVVAVVAVVVLTASYGRVPWAALAIAVSWSTYGLVKRSMELDAFQGLAGETLVMAPLAVALVVTGWGHAESLTSTASAGEWALVAGTGVVTAVPLVLFGIAARLVPFTILGVLQYIVPIINFVLGWAVYDETLPAPRVVGFVLVWIALAAITVEQVHRLRRPRAVDPTPEAPVPLAPSTGAPT